MGSFLLLRPTDRFTKRLQSRVAVKSGVVINRAECVPCSQHPAVLRLLKLKQSGIVGLQRDVLAAAAADADQHLSIGAPIALAHGRVDYPRESEVTCSDRTSDQVEVVDDYRVKMSRSQNATELISRHYS